MVGNQTHCTRRRSLCNIIVKPSTYAKSRFIHLSCLSNQDNNENYVRFELVL